MLLEHGKIMPSVEALRKAASLAPEAIPIRAMLAQGLVETGNPALLGEAVENLKALIVDDPGSAAAWRLLAISYARLGNDGASRLASAELALLQRDVPAAKLHANAALKFYDKGTPSWLRAQDILNAADLK